MRPASRCTAQYCTVIKPSSAGTRLARAHLVRAQGTLQGPGSGSTLNTRTLAPGRPSTTQPASQRPRSLTHTSIAPNLRYTTSSGFPHPIGPLFTVLHSKVTATGLRIRVLIIKLALTKLHRDVTRASHTAKTVPGTALFVYSSKSTCVLL
jgi:hypothetical protein